MNIDELLDIMDETLEQATSVPFTGGKRMVDIEKVRDLIDDIRLNMPGEIRQAKAIVQDRGDIISTANKEAEAIVKRAEDRARTLVSQEEIVKAAAAEARDIKANAQGLARETRSKMTDYCENLLRKTEEQMSKSMGELKILRTSLRQNAKNNLK
ncbi:MAG: ATPase [Ruthenibacterium sp.]